METETHFVDTENLLYRTKVDLFKKSDQLAGFKVVCWDRVVECHLDNENNPTFKVRKLEEDDKPSILREGFKNVGKQWSIDDVKQLKTLFESEDGDLHTISKKLERTENGIRLKLLSMRLIDEDGEKMDVIRKDDQPISSEEWTEEEVYQLRMMFDETNGDIKKTSKKLKRTEKSVRMKLFFLGIIDEEEVIWMKKIPQRPPKPNKKRGKVWTKDEDEKLINLYEKYDGDIVKISKEMKREERSVRMKLFFLDMISEDDVVWMDKIHKKDY